MRHAMDSIPVRQLRFSFDDAQAVWSQTNPDFSIFMNALGIHVPYFERFLVKVMREFRDEIENAKLLGDVQAIIGQESHHAFNFVEWTKFLANRYPKVPTLDTSARNYFETAFLKRSKQFKIGFTAGYETFTFLGGAIILNRYKELMAESDPTIRALWVWHQVEEVEHGAVAFDFYKAFYPDSEWYRRYMVILAFCHISFETFKAFAHMIKTEGYYHRPGRAWRAWRFFISFAYDLGHAAIPVLSSNYHPRNHPICEDRQNAIAVAWRGYHAAGNDTSKLSNADMAHMATENTD